MPTRSSGSKRVREEASTSQSDVTVKSSKDAKAQAQLLDDAQQNDRYISTEALLSGKSMRVRLPLPKERGSAPGASIMRPEQARHADTIEAQDASDPDSDPIDGRRFSALVASLNDKSPPLRSRTKRFRKAHRACSPIPSSSPF